MDLLKSFYASIKSGWMRFADWFGELNQSILLGIFYFIGIGIYAIIMKPFLWFQKKPATTWRTFKDNQENLEDLEKSF